MILLNSFLCDVLKPKSNEKIPYYDAFIAQYTSITVSTIVSQCSLMAETYSGLTEEELDNDINGLIDSIPESAEKKRQAYKLLCMGAMIDPGKTVQESEDRTFISEYFVEESNKYGISNRELIIHSLNASAFMNYFILIEDTLKNLYLETTNSDENQEIGGSKVVSVCLEGILKEKNLKNSFTNELIKRSKFFINFASLKKIWSLLNYIRNRAIHNNGYYDDNALKIFDKKLEQISKLYQGRESHLLTINMFLTPFENIRENISTHGYMLFNDTLENIIRNISIFIMESLYLCDKKQSL